MDQELRSGCNLCFPKVFCYGLAFGEGLAVSRCEQVPDALWSLGSCPAAGRRMRDSRAWIRAGGGTAGITRALGWLAANQPGWRGPGEASSQ